MRSVKFFSQRSCIVVISSFLVLFLSSIIFPNIEQRFYDYRFQLIRQLVPDNLETTGNVVVVGIDGIKSLRDKPLIFWYPQIADALQTAADHGALAIGIDIIPYHSLGEKLDSVLKELGEETGEEHPGNIGNDLDRSLIVALMRSSSTIPVVQGYNGDIVPYYYGMMAHMSGAMPASLLIDYDDDGVLRSSRAADNDGSPRLVAALCSATQLCRADNDIFVDYKLTDNIQSIDFNDFINNTDIANRVKDKIVLIGLVNSNEDMVQTPIGHRNGIYYHATALASILNSSDLEFMPKWVSALLLLALCILGYLVSSKFDPKMALACISIITFCYLFTDTYLFYKSFVIPVFPHAFAMALAAAITYPYKYLVEERDRLKLLETFSYYVDKSVIDKLIVSDAKQLMKGELHNVTVMALDIRNFTSLSNSFSPEIIVDLLNHLFSKFTEEVQSRGGFVNKFIGDGLLAFFPGEESPSIALDTANSLVTIVREMNKTGELVEYIQSWRINIGIGLHYGPAIMGNIGSSRKMDFTVIGPTVNLAFRIESATKDLGTNILVTHEVYEHAKDSHDLHYLGTVRAKGFETEIRVYSPQTGAQNEATL